MLDQPQRDRVLLAAQEALGAVDRIERPVAVGAAGRRPHRDPVEDSVTRHRIASVRRDQADDAVEQLRCVGARRSSESSSPTSSTVPSESVSSAHTTACAAKSAMVTGLSSSLVRVCPAGDGPAPRGRRPMQHAPPRALRRVRRTGRRTRCQGRAPCRSSVLRRYSSARSATAGGSSPATRSASVTVSSTRRRLPRIAIHTSGSPSAGPG